MERMFRGALSRAVAHVVGSRFAKPMARVALAAAGLALLAFIGRTAVAGAVAASATSASACTSVVATTPPPASAAHASGNSAPSTPASSLAPIVPVAAISPSSPSPPPSPHASIDDPVVLNSASELDLRRLPGIGAKRADAILALRTHLGRFHAIEDLLKVKGMGRATLKRLRPFLRLDPGPPDAGVPHAG